MAQNPATPSKTKTRAVPGLLVSSRNTPLPPRLFEEAHAQQDAEDKISLMARMEEKVFYVKKARTITNRELKRLKEGMTKLTQALEKLKAEKPDLTAPKAKEFDDYRKLKEQIEQHEGLIKHADALLSHDVPPLSAMQKGHRLHPENPALKHQWPQNTTVLASSLQGRTQLLGNKHLPVLEKHLRTSDTLHEAHHKAEAEDIVFEEPRQQQNLVSTPRILPGWDKREQRPRKVLLVLGAPKPTLKLDAPDKKSFRSGVTKMMKENYGLTDENMEVLVEPNEAQLRAGLERLQAFAQANPGAEALIGISAHGNEIGYEPGLTTLDEHTRQGSMIGKMELTRNDDGIAEYVLKETALKKMVAEYLSDFRHVALLFDGCHTGAFIAQQPNPWQQRTQPA